MVAADARDVPLVRALIQHGVDLAHRSCLSGHCAAAIAAVGVRKVPVVRPGAAAFVRALLEAHPEPDGPASPVPYVPLLDLFLTREPLVRLLFDATEGGSPDASAHAAEGWAVVQALVTHCPGAARRLTVDLVCGRFRDDMRERDQELALNALLRLGVDPDARGGRGWTALMQAAARGWVGGMVVLLGRGADPDLVNEQGMTAREVAERLGHKQAWERSLALANSAR